MAVSKLKPVEMLQAVYDAGQRHFGENYVQEIVDKAPTLPSDIKWHFIGHLQSNKCKKLVTGVPSLYMVESVDSTKLANKLNTAVAAAGNDITKAHASKLLQDDTACHPLPPTHTEREPLNIMVQVNTTQEPQKSGVEPKDASALVGHVMKDCPALKFAGLMTIGKLGDVDAKYFEVCNLRHHHHLSTKLPLLSLTHTPPPTATSSMPHNSVC